RMLGWMASIRLRSVATGGYAVVHVTPPSIVRSKCTCHALGSWLDSVLLGATIVSSESRTGLFLMGPRKPSGRRRALVHVCPLSPEVRTLPHTPRGLGPALDR